MLSGCLQWTLFLHLVQIMLFKSWELVQASCVPRCPPVYYVSVCFSIAIIFPWSMCLLACMHALHPGLGKCTIIISLTVVVLMCIEHEQRNMWLQRFLLPVLFVYMYRLCYPVAFRPVETQGKLKECLFIWSVYAISVCRTSVIGMREERIKDK